MSDPEIKEEDPFKGETPVSDGVLAASSQEDVSGSCVFDPEAEEAQADPKVPKTQNHACFPEEGETPSR